MRKAYFNFITTYLKKNPNKLQQKAAQMTSPSPEQNGKYSLSGLC